MAAVYIDVRYVNSWSSRFFKYFVNMFESICTKNEAEVTIICNKTYKNFFY